MASHFRKYNDVFYTLAYIQRRRRLEQRLAMTWYLVISAIVACLAALRLLQVVGERRDARRFPPPGRMVGAAGRRLHVLIKGSGPGPAIVIEQGAGGFGVLWWAVQDALAEFATVVT